ncbi:MAG: sulfatase-like hydrolase/transferase [Xenococcaceae cyanobacterium MO_188.B32]|nr:sulfatase-like hydrolase/transferase [Xenococcaceae cyanobacterium MO_188.B32]
MKILAFVITIIAVIVLVFTYNVAANTNIAINTSKPNIILVMSDDQGWGQVGYYNHPILKTPNLDEMAKNGLRFDRFYAGAPNCSPTRATVLTGRSNDRTGVINHSHALRLQERTLAEALRQQGYATAHFGKWHLDGIQGPGVPILATDPYNPGRFGFEQWLSTTNFFELNPILSRNGKFEEFKGDSSKVIVAEALKFMRLQQKKHKPFFTTIWYGSPHRPFFANQEDKESLVNVEEEERRQQFSF